MKIAIIYDMIYPYNIGGVEVRNFEIANRLAKNDEVHLFGTKLWDGPDVIKKGNITLHGVCQYSNPYNFHGIRTVFEPIKFAFKLYKPLKKEKFDIIDSTTFVYFHCFTCKLISMLNKTPLVFTWHQYWGNYWYNYAGKLKGFFGKYIEKSVKKFTNFHIAVSKRTTSDLIKEGIDEKNIFLSYNGINFNTIANANNSEKKYDIIFVGRLIHQKNVSLLIKAVNIIKKDFPNIKICIIGDGPDREELEELTKKLKLESNIRFFGFLPELKDVYSKMKESKIFVLPSLLEGFGIVVTEAMACGLPVIVTDSPWSASKELINPNESGLIVENNEEKLAQSIKYLLSNPEQIKIMSEHAKESSKKFNWDNIATELEIHYQKIIALWKQP